MKYLSETGVSKEELIKKIYSKYGQRVYLYKFVTEEIPQVIEPSGLFKKFKKPKEIKKKLYRCYFGVPEIEDINEKSLSDDIDLENKKDDFKDENKNNKEKEEKREERADTYLVKNSNDEIKKEISEIKSIIEKIVESNKSNAKDTEVIDKIEQFMLYNSFSINFTKDFVSNIFAPLDSLDVFKLILKERIRLNINIKNGLSGNDGRFFMMIGPTGVGKTTTLAKIAAIFYKNVSKNIRFASFDSYRLGADLQMKKYAEIFNKPFNLLSNEGDVKDFISTVKDNEYVFIDTAGESITKDIKINEIKKFIRLFPQKPIILLNISANSKAGDIIKVKDKFSVLGYDYYIVTKIDETMTLGSVIEACYKDNRAIVYLTNGQSVPEDILVPDIDRIIEYLKDLN